MCMQLFYDNCMIYDEEIYIYMENIRKISWDLLRNTWENEREREWEAGGANIIALKELYSFLSENLVQYYLSVRLSVRPAVGLSVCFKKRSFLF